MRSKEEQPWQRIERIVYQCILSGHIAWAVRITEKHSHFRPLDNTIGFTLERLDPTPFRESTTIIDNGMIVKKYMTRKEVGKMMAPYSIYNDRGKSSAILKIMYTQNKTAEEAQWIYLQTKN